jgi:hypothetical protein
MITNGPFGSGSIDSTPSRTGSMQHVRLAAPRFASAVILCG